MVVAVKTPPQSDYGSEIKIETTDQILEPAANARQGVTGHNVRYVLIASLAGVVIFFAVIYLLFFAG